MIVIVVVGYFVVGFIAAMATFRLQEEDDDPMQQWAYPVCAFLMWPLILVFLAFSGIMLAARKLAGVRPKP